VEEMRGVRLGVRRSRGGAGLLAALLALGAAPSWASTFTVTNTMDSGVGDPVPNGSLRKAILDANATPAVDTIQFNIGGGGTQVIQLVQSLPTITAPVTIDGFTQGGSLPNSNPTPLPINAALRVVLRGGPGIGGLVVSHLTAGSTTIKGLVIQSFGGDGISLLTPGNRVEGNFVGTNADGTAAMGNVDDGVAVGSSDNIIGGLDPAKRNLISGNGFPTPPGAGIRIFGSSMNNQVYGNYVGTDKNGILAIPNAENGITVAPASQNVIGAALNGAGNLVSGNVGFGISLSNASNNLVAGNFVGVNATLALALPNTLDGINVFDSPNNLIGGVVPLGTNLVSGNGESGIVVTGSLSLGNIVRGNLVGTDISQSLAVGNTLDGIAVLSSNTIVGGTVPLEGNVVSGNGRSGVVIAGGAGNVTVQGNVIGMGNGAPLPNLRGLLVGIGATGNLVGGDIGPSAGCIAPCNIIAFNTEDGIVNGTIEDGGGNGNRFLGNSVYSNGSAPEHLGIDLWLDGITPNDPGDTDGNETTPGGNNAQNFPSIAMALVSPTSGQVMVRGSQDSHPSAGTNRIQFFATPNDGNGPPEGKRFIREMTNVPNGPFDTGAFAPPSSMGGEVITATATTLDGTSEFSAQVPAVTNVLPVANAGPNQSVTTGNVATLNGSASNDPDGQPSGPAIAEGRFTWTQTAGPAVSLANPSSSTPSFTAAVAGTYVFSLVVSDGLDASTNSASVSVTATDPGITVVPTSGLVTTEAGGTATFTVRLDTLPTAVVTIALSSSDTTEGTVSPASLTFTPANGTTPQPVTVTGVDDVVDDGNVGYTIVTAAAVSADPAYDGRAAADVSVTNQDDDAAGITVAPTAGLVTTEAGGTATFTVRLDTLPTSDVTIALGSSDATEGTVSPASLTFTPANGTTPRTVTVTGVDDGVPDGDVAYMAVTAPAVSADPAYDGRNAADVSLTNLDDDMTAPGITVTPTGGLVTTEGGGTATFTVRLNTLPAADVTIDLTSSNPQEGVADAASLTFTPGSGTTPQTVTVTGVDDLVVDGSVDYSIVTAPSASGDPDYDGLDAADVSLTNLDDDSTTPGITVTPTSGLLTTEGGGTATLAIALDTLPAADVTIGLSSSDVTEGTVSPSSVTFTAANGTTPQMVTVTGVDDLVIDGAVSYTILTAPAVSADPAYGGLDGADAQAANQDDDVAGIAVTPTAGLVTTESGGTATFTVALATLPSGTVTIGLGSSDTTEGTVSPASLTFTPANGTTPQTVTVTGVDDLLLDGNVAYTIVTAPAGGADPDYLGLNPADVSATNQDNEVTLAGFASTPAAPGPIPFGARPLGTPGTGTLIIRETGSGLLAVTDPVLGGADPGDFALATPFPVTVADGAPPVAVQLTCTPSAVGPRTATLTVETNDPASPSVTYTLNCVGLAPGTTPRGDFDRDTRTDLFFRHDVTGDNVVWFLDGVTLAGSGATSPALPDTNWALAGLGDLNGDGGTDLVWHNRLRGLVLFWYLDGLTRVGATYTTPPQVADTSWSVVSAADFNQDGKPDLLWRNGTSGQIVVWYMDGPTLLSGTFTTPSALPDLGWVIVGTADFNSDARPDILWHHTGSGQVVVWHMSGATLLGGTFTDPPALADTGWRLVATGDFNLDGKPDLVWRHSGSGQIVAWFLDGTRLVGGGFTTPPAVDPVWKLAGPR
jgi:hypothetical protein